MMVQNTKERRMKNNEIFHIEHPVENEIFMGAQIKKTPSGFTWAINLTVKKEGEMISFRGNAESVKECMIRMRNMLLGFDDVVHDILADVKDFVLNEYIEDAEFGDDDAEFK